MEANKNWFVTHNADDTFTIDSKDHSVRGYRAIHLSASDAQSVLRDLIGLMHKRAVGEDNVDATVDSPSTVADMILENLPVS